MRTCPISLLHRPAGFHPLRCGGALRMLPLPAELRATPARRGIEVRPGAGEDSGSHGVLLRDGRRDGAADPRREGVVGRP